MPEETVHAAPSPTPNPVHPKPRRIWRARVIPPNPPVQEPTSPPTSHLYSGLYQACVSPKNERILSGRNGRERIVYAGQAHPYGTLYQLCAKQPQTNRREIRDRESREIKYLVAEDTYGTYYFDINGELQYVYWRPLNATYTGKGAFLRMGSIEAELDGSQADWEKRFNQH